MSELYVSQWLVAFLLTQSIEMGVYTGMLQARRPLQERLAIAFGASAITHPIVWFVIPPAMSALRVALELDVAPSVFWWDIVAVSEAFAFGAEVLWLAAFGLGWRRALFASLLANGASFTLGLLCYEWFGW